MAACDLTLKNGRIDVIYNDISTFLDQDKGCFLLKDFSEVVLMKDAKGVQVIKDNGKEYYFTIDYPNVGQMVSINFRELLGRPPVLALPVATWDGEPITSNSQLYDLIRDAS